jgi:argininosuccinate lyase
LGQALDGLALIAGNAGLPGVASASTELADVFDEAGDPLALLADMVKNQEFTKEKIREVIDQGKEVGIEAVDFFVKIIKKK